MDEDELNAMLDELSGQEIIGAQEIIGVQEIIGKAVRQATQNATVAAMRNARVLDPNAVMLQQSKAGPRRRKVLAGTSTSVGAGMQAPIEFSSQENFRPEQFFVQGVNIDSFVINSIKVGTEEQFVNTGAVPADVFSPQSLRSDIHFKTMNLGSKLVVTVTNTSGGALSFVSAFIGTAVE